MYGFTLHIYLSTITYWAYFAPDLDMGLLISVSANIK